MTEKYIGLMSGTSLDRMDSVLVSFDKDVPEILSHYSMPLPELLFNQVITLASSGDNEIDGMATADIEIAKLASATVNNLLKRSGESADSIKAIGSHGQTIRHRPQLGYTLQIGDPSLIAELTGITVVADFRRRDIAAGGQGAPLVPAFHRQVFFNPNESRVIVNIGGISNISILSSKNDKPMAGFDTGPGNILMDYWCKKNKDQPYDNNGKWAASAQYSQELLSSMLTDSFFYRPVPKSTGRELFNSEWLEGKLDSFPEIGADVVQATLCRLTATTIATAIKDYAADTQAVFVCGGGANNKELMDILGSQLSGIRLSTTDDLGINSEMVEAVAFAWLAKQRLNNQPGNLPEATGANGFRVLGGVYSK